MNNESNRGILIAEIINNTIAQNIFNTEVELKENLQVELNNQLLFETLVSDIESKDGFNFGQVVFKNEDDVNSVIDFRVTTTSCEMKDCPHCAHERQERWEAELEKEACIDFAKWLAQSDWMSTWVKDKWMWECQLEDSKLGYKTEEELYQIYLNEF